MITVVTTASQEGYKQYGQRFLGCFARHWPVDTRLIIYTEGWSLGGPDVYDLLEASSWLKDFKARHRKNPEANGRRGYRWNAVKFAHKVAAVIAADRITKDSHLLWLDADVVTHADVRPFDIEGWIPDPAYLSWLDREPRLVNYPEAGFLLFNRRHPGHASAMERMYAMYAHDEVFKLPETHDSFVWQHVIQTAGLATRSLSGKGYNQVHVLPHSPLGAWFDHLKGPNRKIQGRTGINELKFKRPEPYWGGR